MITKKQKEYCIHNLSAMVLEIMREKDPEKDISQLSSEFFSSKTYEKLSDVRTRLWAEGPDFIHDMYVEEQCSK